MSFKRRNMRLLFCVNRAEADTGTQGGAIAKLGKWSGHDLGSSYDTLYGCSDAAGDTTQTITVTGRDDDGTLIEFVETLNGTTPVVFDDSDYARVLKAIKSAACAGTVGLYYNTSLNSQTIPQDGGSADCIILSATETLTAANAQNAVLIATINGVKEIREIVEYNATTKRAYVHDAFPTAPDSGDTYEIHKGWVFDKISGETEVTTVARPFYKAKSNAAGGGSKTYYEGAHVWNNGDKTLDDAVLKLSENPSGNIKFAVDGDGLDGVDTAVNRLTAPTGFAYVFDTNDKNVSNSQNLTPGHSQQIWWSLTLAEEADPLDSYFTMQLDGATT